MCAHVASQKFRLSEQQSTYSLQEALLEDLIGCEFDIAGSQKVVTDVISGKGDHEPLGKSREKYTYGGISGNMADTVSTFGVGQLGRCKSTSNDRAPYPGSHSSV